MYDNHKSIVEATINYTVEANKQAYEFGTKMAQNYAEFTKTVMKMIPGMDAWAQLVSVSNKK